jgi:HD-like signal output (HDOD) protein
VDTEYAFLCGLLHDVGIAACLLALADDARRGPLPFASIADVVGGVHEEASGIVARLWALPGEIQRVVASHHRLEHGGRPSPVNAALIVAERLAADAGASASPASGPNLDAEIAGEVDAARAFLGLDAAALGQLRAEAAEIAAAAD